MGGLIEHGVWFLFLFCCLTALALNPTYPECSLRIEDWYSREIETLKTQPVQHTGSLKPALLPILFFLHVPRTGGRTYHLCFLKSLFAPVDRCPRSYDVLRIDTSNPECRLLSSHDDYSLATRLPLNQTSVITNIRDPVERAFSAYEFAIEIAARTLQPVTMRNVSKSQARQIFDTIRRGERRRQGDKKSLKTETWNVWPWSYLVPFMEEDLWNRYLSEDNQFPEDSGPYNTPRCVIPFLDFIRHPIAKDLIHNGGTLQITGLTNYSSYPEANFLRNCAQSHKSLGEKVLQVAKMRLDRMLYVGLTEKHFEAVKLFSHVIGRPLSSPAFNMGGISGRTADGRLGDLEARLRRQKGFVGNLSLEQRKLLAQSSLGRKGAPSILRQYKKCVAKHRERYKAKRLNVFRVLDPVFFSKEGRGNVSAVVLDELRALNSLDMALWQHAKLIFKNEQRLYENNLEGSEAVEEAVVRIEEEQSVELQKQLKLSEKQALGRDETMEDRERKEEQKREEEQKKREEEQKREKERAETDAELASNSEGKGKPLEAVGEGGAVPREGGRGQVEELAEESQSSKIGAGNMDFEDKASLLGKSESGLPRSVFPGSIIQGNLFVAPSAGDVGLRSGVQGSVNEWMAASYWRILWGVIAVLTTIVLSFLCSSKSRKSLRQRMRYDK